MFPLVFEYLASAHGVSWDVVCGRQTVEIYRMLVACAIACLYTILSEPGVHPFIEIQVRLKLATLLSEESVNWQEATKLVSRGTTLAKSYNYYTLAMQLKYASVKAMAFSPGTSTKTTLTMLDAYVAESQALAEQSEDATAYFSFMFLKISVLFNANTLQEANEGIRQLGFLQEFKGKQDNVAHLAFTMHALKLFQLGSNNADEILNFLAQAKALETKQIPLQMVYMRVIYEILILVELCDYKALDRAQDELFDVLQRQQEEQGNNPWVEDTIDIPLEPFIVAGGKPGTLQMETSTLQSKTVVVSWISPSEANILAYLLAGLINLRIRGKAKLAAHLLQQGLAKIKAELESPPELAMSLRTARAHHDRLRIMQCYTLLLLTLERFLASQWTDDAYLKELLHTTRQLPANFADMFTPLTYYLSGAYFQASGNMHNAIQFYLKIREHPCVAPTSGLYIIATINLVLVLEGSQAQKYNNFEVISKMEEQRRDEDDGGSTGAEAGRRNSMIKEQTLKGAKSNETPSAYYRRELLRPVCATHASPMVQWALQLLDAVYDSGPRDHNKLAVLVQFAVRLDNLQVGAVVAGVAGHGGGDMTVQDRERLARRGVADAEQEQSALWGWMNGVLLENLEREAGNMEAVQSRHKRNKQLKKTVEAQLNRVD
ncbi:uncharacterized protein SAPINGB_P002387 [Magnusiomyces paraingens]|uniref:Cohesin loading factor n=1 Tax=Magnusiomyces paraingens TaxID=2606893 RepID=A0A5E8BDM7_9ASCO|nr:uncharacterized protein SAPINGB_P002387 [Saprochaete ingens]VVT49675.1 unnamed protein product [Saprochaete ingens]